MIMVRCCVFAGAVAPLFHGAGVIINLNLLIVIYYINSRILCVCVRVSVISEISGTGGRSAMLLAPTWRASPGE